MKRFFAPDETHLIFQRELAPLSVLKHDNVIRLLTAFLHGGIMHAIFELLEHSLLDELKIKGCGLESLTIKKYSFQILRAVDFIHSRNIMHRDIKPDNLLVSCSGVLKLADFGSSRASNHAAEPLTRDAGAMLFSAPEMLLMDPDYNKPVDVWAVGCTLVFMATGNYFLNGERFLEHIKMIITKVGPLTALQEQQYFNNVKYATDFGALPVVHPTTDLKEKYGISDPLLAQLVEMCLQMDPVDRWRCSALLRHPYYTQDHFHESFPKELEEMVDHDQSVHLMENKYPLTSTPTGLCLIINNENFQDGTKRRGSEKVAESLATLFSWLGFQVLMCKDQTASDMAQVTKLLADLKDLPGLKKCKLEEWSDGRSTPLSVLPQHGDAFVCCVLSHGAEKVVLGVDRKPLPISDITWAFNKEHCPALLGKPKVFFIQACQGHRLQTGLVMDDHPLECDAIDLGRPKVEDGLRVVSIPGEADILVAVATVEKFQAVRHRENGSWFIQSLCEQLREGCPRGEDIMLILRRVIDDDFGGGAIESSTQPTTAMTTPAPGTRGDPPQENTENLENKYPLTSKPTGLCLIINNENFQDGTNRRGTEKDAGRC
ncbi:unnamed protein product [Gadus morhua 'NCC']